jgi:hypothetical protein
MSSRDEIVHAPARLDSGDSFGLDHENSAASSQNPLILAPSSTQKPGVDHAKVDAFAQHGIAHKLTNHRLHSLSLQVPLNRRVSMLQSGHTMMAMVHRARSSIMSDGAPDVMGNDTVGAAEDTAHRGRNSLDYSESEEEEDVISARKRRNSYEMDNFSMMIEEQTVAIQIPVDVDAPQCSCSEACMLRMNTETQQRIWVCSALECMYFVPFFDSSPGGEHERVLPPEKKVEFDVKDVGQFWIECMKLSAVPDLDIVDFLVGKAAFAARPKCWREI